jgi:tRNA pseudouridine38-40 synthase
VRENRNIKLLLAFDGTGYAGWQKQKSEKTVQGVIEERLQVMTGECAPLHGAGRTDAGVHALGMVANFVTGTEIPCQGFVKGLNSLLPADIRVLEAEEVDPGFHARRSARAKTYWYNLSSGPVQLPTERLYCAHVFAELDFTAIREGLGHVTGTHDFSSFEGAGSRDPEREGRGAVRTIFEASLKTMAAGKYHRFVITGDGFLRHMVRNIVGTMLEVGQGRLVPAEVAAILAARDRSAAGSTAPLRVNRTFSYEKFTLRKRNSHRKECCHEPLCRA